jgi:hypothetical protein
MTKHKAGLHKDVSTIFDGVWNPERDNLVQPAGRSETTGVAYLDSKAMALDQWPREPKSVTFLKVFWEAPGYLFRSRARRERKRLLSISKHLIINLPS